MRRRAPRLPHFADEDPFTRVALERMFAGVSCRRYARTQEPDGVKGAARASVG